jgi:hypothetical protein
MREARWFTESERKMCQENAGSEMFFPNSLVKRRGLFSGITIKSMNLAANADYPRWNPSLRSSVDSAFDSFSIPRFQQTSLRPVLTVRRTANVKSDFPAEIHCANWKEFLLP